MQEEKLVRRVSEIGNGAHIFAPKEWLNEEVILIRIQKKAPKEEILKLLHPHLDKIIAVFLYGSYARDEQDKSSDMDVFVISSEKFSVKSKGIEVIVVPEDKIELAKKLNPILFYSMLNEAKPVINSSYLKKLKSQKINFDYFKHFIQDTEKAIVSNKEIIDLDTRLKNEYASESLVYSLILRLRGIFMMNLQLSRKNYSKKNFSNWLVKNSKADYDKIYKIYQAVRNEKKTEEKVPIKQAESILDFLAKENKKLERKLNGKKKEEA
jgi:predicted nucleotidyltransferase